MKLASRTVRGFVPSGSSSAAVLSCGHRVITGATHVRRMRCPHCEAAARRREHEWIHSSDSPFAQRHRQVLAAQAAQRAARNSDPRPSPNQAPPSAGPQSQEGA